MKQKDLTEKQKEILKRLERVLTECVVEKIGFVFDEEDSSLTAFNAENVNLDYCCRHKDDDKQERIDWDKVSIVSNFRADYFHNGFDTYYLYFEE